METIMTAWRRRVALFLLLLVPGAYLLGGTSGKIAGVVTNSATKEPVPSISVVIVGTSAGSATDLEGQFAILNVAPGTYRLRASGVGYTAVIVENVKVSMDLTTAVNFKLNETSIQMEDQVVVAERPRVTKDLTASTAVVTADNIASLPVTDFQDVLRLQAGVVGNNVRGGRQGEVVYAIDGVPMTDVFDGSSVIDVNPNAIQELQFVSGAFNAEYGRALSAYVNIATKEGDQTVRGSLTAYGGDYASGHTDIFRGIDKFKPLGIRNAEGSLSGPLPVGGLFFFVDGRYSYSDGWMRGKKVFNPWDITVNRGSDQPLETRYLLQETGGGGIVPMNWSEKKYLQGKLTYKPFSDVTIAYNMLIDRHGYQDFDPLYAYNPDGMVKRFNNGYTNVLSLTHMLSPSVYYQANASYFFKEYKHYVYEDPGDPRWTDYRLFTQQPQEVPSFYTGGTDNQHYRRTTSTYAFKLDFTAQMTKEHQVKAGVDLSAHRLTYEVYSLLQSPGLPDPSVSMNPFVTMQVPDPNNPDENLSIDRYTRRPVEFSVYAQDKFELSELIINVGLRYDYFAPDGQVLNDPSDPDIYRPLRPENLAKTLAERRLTWYRNATPKNQVMPRLGVAFPITDRGVVHFSYGHFFQVPSFTYLYQNPEYKFGTGSGNLGIAGNPDLKPEQTIIGEVGVQQAIAEDLSFDVTGYFRNIKNLTGTRTDEIQLFGGSGRYSQYVNSDFGFVRGIVVSVTKRLADNWSATLDYTLQTAKGNASDPAATRNQLVGGAEPEIQLVPLDWDQRHTVNLTFSYASPDRWGFSVVGRYGSGVPYTPTESMNISDLLTNSEFKPATYTVDLRANKDFRLGSVLLSVFVRVFNVLDTKNQLNVYNDTGTADFTEQEYLFRTRNLTPVVNTLDEYYRNPTYYSEPRRVEFGVMLSFN